MVSVIDARTDGWGMMGVRGEETVGGQAVSYVRIGRV